MSNMLSITGRRIAVEVRPDGLFVDDVRVITEAPFRKRRSEWPKTLSTETKVGLGLDEYCWSVRLHDCRACHAPFIAHYAAHLCSPACVAAELAKRRAEESAYWAARRALMPIPKTVQRRAALAQATCDACGIPFQAKRLTARFCSDRCRRRRHREKLLAAAARALAGAGGGDTAQRDGHGSEHR